MEAWVYLNTGQTGNRRIYSKYSGITGPINYSFRVSGAIIGLTNGTSTVSHQTALSTDVWTHIAFSLMTNGTANVFVNGVVNTTATPLSVSYNSTYPTLIGVGTGEYFNGYIRDLRVVQGGVVPVATFTPGAAPFSYASPGYVANMGTTVFTLLGQFITYPSGKYLNSMRLAQTVPNSGANNYVLWSMSSTPINIDATGITVSAWVNFNTFSGSFVSIYDSFSNVIGLSMTSTQTRTGQGFLGTQQLKNATTISATNSTGTWYHVALTYDSTSVILYRNGVGATPIATGSTGGVVITGLRVGSQTNIINPSYSGYQSADCTIDDLRIYNTALTAAQVQSVYSSQGAPAPSRAMPLPKLAWDFNGTTTDYVSGVVPTTTTGTPTYVAGKYGQAIQFTNSAGSAPTQRLAYPVSLSSSSGITASFWVQFNTYNTGFQTPFSLGDSSSYLNIFGTSVIYLYWQRGSNSVQASPGFSYSTGTWYHIALCYSAQTVTLYINGVGTVGTLYIGGTPSGTNVGADTTFTAAYAGSQNTSLAFNGLVDDLRIFDRALTSAQVQSIYNQQGVPGRGVQTNTRGILDVMNTPTAAAFSLRQLTSTYTGPVVQIRRQSDLISNNFVADFSGNLSNVQNGTTLQTFLTSTYGNVTTWYDQSGNGRNASQASATNAPVIIQTSNLNMKWALTTTYANPNGSTFLNVSGGTFLNATDFTIMSTSRRTITSNSKTNNALYAYGANSSWQSYTSNVTYPDNSRFVCEFPYQGNRATWNQRANPQNAEAFATIPYYIAGSEPVTYLSLVSKGSINQTTLYCNNAVASTTAAYAQCNANVLMTSAFTIGGASAYGSFGGEIGEFIIFPSALTAAQVSQNYNSEVKNSSGGVVSLTGTPLFTQLSQAATSSAVGAFSLRAVNGTSARAVQVVAHPVGTWPPVAMTSNTTTATGTFNGVTNGVYTASESPNAYAGQTYSYGAFDSNPTDGYWHSALTYNADGSYNGTTTQTDGYTGEWLQIQFPTPIILYSYSMINRSGFNARTPKNFRIYGSTNGTNWTIVDTQSNITQWLWPNRLTFTITNPSMTPYNYFRMVVNATSGPDSIQISSWVLNGPAAAYTTGSATDFYADRLGNLLTAPVTGQSLANWLGGATGYVTTWYDQSGRGNHATQLTAANQPIITRATKGQGYACLFNGANSQVLACAAGTYSLLNGTKYAVCVTERRNNAGTQGGYFGIGSTGGGGTGLIAGYFNSDTNIVYSHRGDNLDNTVAAYAGASEPIRYTVFDYSASTTKRVYINSSILPVTNTSYDLVATTGAMTIGKSFGTGNSTYYYGEIYELLVFTQSLYDLDNTGGLITKIYQNQLSYTGA
jgi:hypothetical protein